MTDFVLKSVKNRKPLLVSEYLGRVLDTIERLIPLLVIICQKAQVVTNRVIMRRVVHITFIVGFMFYLTLLAEQLKP